jgi:sarcosine oxidase
LEAELLQYFGMERYDTLVLGLGAMGSAAVYQLAKRGRKVLGLDQFSPPHAFGSSHGDTRITRLAIGEGEHYTPLVMRSHEIWREIERETGINLLTVTGGLVISSRAKTSVLHVQDFFATTVAAAKRYRIAHEVLDANAIRRRFPEFNVRDDEIGYYESEAGFVRPDTCIQVQLNLAKKYGAAIRSNEKVLGFEPSRAGVIITTDKDKYVADRLVVSAGAWLPELIGESYAKPFAVRRQTLFWFAPKGSAAPFLPGNFPIYIWELQGRKQAIYGFPAVDGESGGVKVATQQYETTTTPDTVDRRVSDLEAAAMYDYITPYLPGLSSTCVKAVACLYTVTPDAEFVIDVHPEFPKVIIASPCSGHGFKHSAAIGEALAELAIDGRSRFDFSAFSLGRFS